MEYIFSPTSIAIVGASEKPSIGRVIQQSLQRLGFAGKVMPVNPKYAIILGQQCFPEISALPESPDLAAICLGVERCLEAVQELAKIGTKAAVIYDGGFGETASGREVQAKIIAICRDAGMALVGPNCMGVLSPWSRSTTYISEVRDADALRGNVGFVSQSGAVCVSLLADLTRFGVSHVISAGNEAIFDTAAFIGALVEDEKTQIIACFTEAVHDPQRYVAALDQAAMAGKPVLVLKAGRNERTRQAIATHTGGLAGEARVFSEVLRKHNAIEVPDFGHLVEFLAAFQSSRRPKGRRVGLITGSGGQAELALDVAAETKIQLPPLSPPYKAQIIDKIGPITGDGNPVDVWGKGQWVENIGHAAKIVSGSGEVDAIAVSFDFHQTNPMSEIDRFVGYQNKLIEVASQTDLPVFHIGVRPGLLHHELAKNLLAHGIPVLGGYKEGFAAISALTKRSDAVARPARQFAQVNASGLLNEVQTKTALAKWAIPVVGERLVARLEDGKRAARELGYPVVLKAVSNDIPHKSDLGLVILDIVDEAKLADAWKTLELRIEKRAPSTHVQGHVVQAMVGGGIEVFAGIKRDREFGLVLAFGLGGIHIEVLKDFSLRVLPLSQGDAAAMIGELRASSIFGGVRGSGPADVSALASCLEALSDFAIAHADRLLEIDLNPIKVFEKGRGCVALDGLIVFEESKNE